jgi:hypothetical protein
MLVSTGRHSTDEAYKISWLLLEFPHASQRLPRATKRQACDNLSHREPALAEPISGGPVGVLNVCTKHSQASAERSAEMTVSVWLGHRASPSVLWCWHVSGLKAQPLAAGAGLCRGDGVVAPLNAGRWGMPQLALRRCED